MQLNNVNEFVLVQSASRDRASLDIGFRSTQEKDDGFICQSCHSLKPSSGDIGEIVVQGVIEDAPFGMVMKGLGIARKEFLFSMGEDVVFRSFNIGPVKNYKGKVLDNWVSYHAKNKHPVRAGMEDAKIRYCDKCGQVFYSALGDKYLYPAPLVGVDVYGNVGASISFFMRSFLAKKIEGVVKDRKWRRVEFIDLPVLSEPKDGLGDFPIKK